MGPVSSPALPWALPWALALLLALGLCGLEAGGEWGPAAPPLYRLVASPTEHLARSSPQSPGP